MHVSLPPFPIFGGCVCGAVRYEVAAPPISVYACHCKDCQRAGGGPFSLAMAVTREDFHCLSGDPVRTGKPADSGRVVGIRFCAACHTRLWHEPAHSPHIVNVVAGTLDDMSWALPVAHVWVGRKLPWVSIDADAIAFEGQPEDREALYGAWSKAVR